MANTFFRRYWYVPVFSDNETDVPRLLQSFKINYERLMVIDEDGATNGYVFKFNCVPGVYTGLKIKARGGNNYHPLEILLA